MKMTVRNLANEEVGDIDECLRAHGEGEVESVKIGVVDPAFELISHRRRRTDDHRTDAAD